jgi:TonB family protein
VSRRKSGWLLFVQCVMAVSLGFLFVTAAVAQDTSKKAQDKSAAPVVRKVKMRVQPMYPELARHMNLSGVVKLELVISPEGKVKSAKVLGGHPLLAEAASDAARRWTYEPAHEQTVEVVEIRFARDSE